MKLRLLCLCSILLAGLLMAAAPGSRADTAPTDVSQILSRGRSKTFLYNDTPKNWDRPATTAQLEPGNYCLSCHTSGDERLAQGLAWQGGIDRLASNPCPAAGQIQQELYYTERLLLAIDRAGQALPGWVDTTSTDARVASARATYSRLLDSPAGSLAAFTSEAQVLRFRLGQSYRQLNQLDSTVKQQYILLAAGLVTLFLLVALGWGWRHTTRFTGQGLGRLRPGWKAILFLALLFILFCLPIFRVFSAAVASTSAEEQARQAALDTAGRVASAADRALARAWTLAQVGAEWAPANAGSGQAALQTALAAAQTAQINDVALWGETQAVREGTIGSPAAQEKAELAAARLNAAHSRAWALRLMAADWTAVDPGVAEALLGQALAIAAKNSGLYRDLDLRAIAVTWAAIDPVQGQAVAGQIDDPALRAWAWQEMAQAGGEAALYDRAAGAARQVTDPVQRARLLAEIAAHSGQKELFDEALAGLEGLTGPALAYALGDLAVAAGRADLVERIDPTYAAARALALSGLGRYEVAWTAAGQISDPFDRAHAQAIIAAAWGNPAAAGQIAEPALRSLALRDIAITSGDVALATAIEAPYYRVQALTALGQYQAALNEAANLGDPYPLRALGVALAQSAPEAALALVDRLDREVDKADVLRAVAIKLNDQASFERALDMALAARVRGDALAPVQASLALARSFEPVDQARAEAAFNQAYQAALSISTR